MRRCVLHGRVSSFFRPSESGVREFFGAAGLAGLGSFLGGVWPFRICCGEVGFWCGGAFCMVEFHLSLGHQKVALESVREFFGAAVLAGLGSFLGGVWLFRICCGEVVFGCGGAFCTVEFHLSLGHQKVAIESFLFLWHLATLYRVWDPHPKKQTRARELRTGKC